ncbi:MAG: hypothetical protein E7471_01510 [Ruminococcaceae bacterium]|nr:hypothetical protein [Oscillospiraceae bacterium]
MNRKILCALLALILTLTLAACGTDPIEVVNPETGTTDLVYLTEEGALSEKDRASIDELLSAFEAALSTQSAEVLMPYVDASFGADAETLTAFFKSIAESGNIPGTRYDEYYVRGLKESTVPVLVKKTTGSQESLQIVPAGKELYIALYVGDETAPVNTMLSLVCMKKGSRFTVAWIDISDYQYRGEDATVLYEKAKTAFADGKVMPALILAQMTGNLATPGNVLHYSDSDEIREFVYKVASEGLEDYPLPMELSVAGVKLHSVATSITEHGVVPMFFYSTETPIEDRAAITAEAKRVYRAIGKVFPGTVETFPRAELRMTNADPETQENFDYETVLVSMN